MNNVYVNANSAEVPDGSILSPWTSLTSLHNKDYDTVDNILIALGTTYKTTARINLKVAHDLTITTYDAGEGSAMPIIECYTSSTDSADWAEVQVDGITPVVSAGDTGLWVIDLGTAFANKPQFVSFGGLGREFAGVRKQYRNKSVYNDYDAAEVPVYNATAASEFDFWLGSVDLNTSLWIYSPQNPIEEFGVVYYQTNQHPVFLIYDAINFTIDGVECKNAFSLIQYFNDPARSTDATECAVRNCVFDYVAFCIVYGGDILDTWIYDEPLFELNTCSNILYTTINHSGNIHGAIERYNSIDYVGISESSGGIYFGRGDAPITKPNQVYNNTISNIVPGNYWPYDGAALYADENTSNTHFFRNKIFDCPSAMNDNSGRPGNKYYSNEITRGSFLFAVSDSGNHGTANIECYNNVLAFGDQGSLNPPYLTVGQKSAAIKIFDFPGAVSIRNNICVSVDDSNVLNTAIYIHTGAISTYDLSNNYFYKYTTEAIDNTGAEISTPVGNAFDTDPLFIGYTGGNYSLQKISPCVGTGVKWWAGTNPLSANGEPFTDFDTDIGAVQTTFSRFHPSNL